jgi:hypothetical protein
LAIPVATSRVPPSAAFSHRELNGEVLLDELEELRSSQVHQKHLNDCAAGLRDLMGLRASVASQRLKQLATNRFAGQPALGSLLIRWAGKLKHDADVPVLLGHLERLALTSAMVSAVRRSSERLDGAGR